MDDCCGLGFFPSDFDGLVESNGFGGRSLGGKLQSSGLSTGTGRWEEDDDDIKNENAQQTANQDGADGS